MTNIYPCSYPALIADELIGESIPSFFGGGGKLDVRHVLLPYGGLDHVESQVMELTINNLSSCHVAGVVGLEANPDDPPKLD